ncbi:MAG: hypothetical protein ACREDM_12860 [Methylocella sp.]
MRRMDTLLAAMTLEEKIGQLSMAAAGQAVTGPVLASGVTNGIRAGRRPLGWRAIRETQNARFSGGWLARGVGWRQRSRRHGQAFLRLWRALAGRDHASADISERLLHKVYLPPFAAAVAAGCAAIMPAFNDVAGIPMTVHIRLPRDWPR